MITLMVDTLASLKRQSVPARQHGVTSHNTAIFTVNESYSFRVRDQVSILSALFVSRLRQYVSGEAIDSFGKEAATDTTKYLTNCLNEPYYAIM
jgi:hypothetical protein